MADNISDPLLEEGTRKASEALGLSLTQLSARLSEAADDADKWLYGTVLEQKATKLASEAAALPGSEEMLAFTAKLQNAGAVPDDYVNEVLVPLIREKTREASRAPLEAGKIAPATAEAVGPVAKDLLLSLKGMAQYGPQALVGTVGGVMEDIGIGATTPEQKQAAELFGAAAEQGTRETGRLLQRGARKLGALTGGPGARQAGRLVGAVEVMEDVDLDKRIQSDLAYWRRQNLVESGQRDVGAIEALLFDAKSWNRRRDDVLEANADLAKQGKPLLLVPPTWEEYSAARKAARPKLTEEQVEMISPLGEVFDLTNYIGVGAGAKAAKVGGRVVAEKAIRTAAEEAAAQAAKQASEVGTLRTLAGTAVEQVGKGAGQLAEKPVLRGVASAAIATAAGAEPVSAALAAILGTSRMTRALAKGAPEAIEQVGKAIKAPLPAPISNFVQIAKDTGAGMTYGAAGMVPFALAADSPEERGALLAGGLVYGGAGGGTAGTLRSIGDFGKSFWSPVKDDPTVPRTKGTSYGTQYDVLHSKVAATLDNPTYNRVEGLRELIRPFSDLYVLSEQDYAALPVPGIDLSQGVNSVVLPNGRKAVFVKLGGSALSHEVGEVILEALPEERRNRIIEAYKTAYPEDVQEMMKQGYEEKVGFRLSPDRAVREGIAENFHAALNGLPIANLGAKPSFAKEIYSAIGAFAEQLGLRNMAPGQGVVTSEALEYTPSFLVRRALENALESMQISKEASAAPQAPAAGAAPAVPTPAAPVAPATTDVGTLVPVPTELTKPSTELTPGAISGVPAQAPQPVAPAPQAPKPAVAGVTEQQRTTVAGTATPELQSQNEAVLAQNLNRPVEVEYLSAKAGEESGDAAVRLRERQLADRNEQEGVPNPFRAVYGKVVVPTSVFQAKNGKRMIFGFSPDKLIRNIDQLRGWYLERGDKAAADWLYSPDFQRQVRAYLENQSNGYRGDGERIARPADTDPALYPPENPDYTPVKIDEGDRNLINFLMGLDPVSPTSVAGQWVMKLAELNGFKPASYVPGAAGKQKPVYNPLTQRLRDAGFDGKLNSAIEQLRIERMTSPAVVRSDLATIKPAVQGSVQAGFMPATPKKVFDALPQEGEGYTIHPIGTTADRLVFNSAYLTADGQWITSPTRMHDSLYYAVSDVVDEAFGENSPEARGLDLGLEVANRGDTVYARTWKEKDPLTSAQKRELKNYAIESGKRLIEEVMVHDGVRERVLYTPEGFEQFMPEAAKPEGRRELVNVGLKIGDRVALTKEDVVKAFADEGLKLEDVQVRESGTEPTVIASVTNADKAAIDRASNTLQQDAIAVFNPADQTGYLAGPRPENFGGKFLKEYFLMPEEGPAMMPKGKINWSTTEDAVGVFPNQQDLAYFGFERLMTPEEFRNLVPPGVSNENTFAFMQERMSKGEPVAPPALFVRWNKNAKSWTIVDHEGRSRSDAAASIEPSVTMPVSVIPRDMRARDLTPSMRKAPFEAQRYMPKPLKGSLGKGDIKFFHYSDTPNKGAIDPKFFGRSGVTGAREQAGLPRAYAYAEGSMLGQDAGLIDARQHYYEGTAPKGKIYDGVEDPLDYASNPNRAKADQMLIDKGFIGVYREGLNGVKQIEFFQPMEVTEAEKPESTGPLAEEAMPILPPLALEEIDYAAQDREFARKKAAGEPLFMPRAPKPGAKTWITEAAIKTSDGTVWTGVSHPEILEENPEILADNFAKVRDGFVTNNGDFVSREDAMRIAEAAGQLEPIETSAVFEATGKRPTELESLQFEELRRFMPKATEAQETAFKDSKVRNEDGSLKPMFHFTTADFSRFGRGDLGYHFGTAEQALDRGVTTEAVRVWGDSEIPSVREGGRTIPVYLDVKNPLRLRDVGSWDSPSDVLQAIPARLRVKLPSAVQEAVQAFEEWENNAPTSISRADEARQRGPQVTKALGAVRDGLKALGYDGVVYRNEFESKGQGEDSYIAFDNDQIMPAFTTDTGARWMPAPPVESEAFRKWFGGSKVVDENGKPLVVYHGTAQEFNTFIPGIRGAYFTIDPKEAMSYAKERSDSSYGESLKPRVISAYLRVENPFDPDVDTLPGVDFGAGTWDRIEPHMDAIRAAGYDGVRVKETPDTPDKWKDWAVFDPTQIKSATDNVGTFDPTNPDIRYMPAQKLKINATRPTELPTLEVDAYVADAVQSAKDDAEAVGDTLSKTAEQRVAREARREALDRRRMVPAINVGSTPKNRVPLNPDTPEKWTAVNDRIQTMLEATASDPDLGLGPDSWSKAWAKSGMQTIVPAAPERFAEYVKNPQMFADWVKSADPQLVESAMKGLDHVRKMHELARAGKLTPEVVALHHAWGLASRMLAPFDQEAGWIRLIRNPEAAGAILDSIDGNFNLTKDQWKKIVHDAMWDPVPETPQAGKVGKNATANLNAFHAMLSKWNGRWQELTDIFNNKDLTGPQMRDEFFRRGFGGAGIKHKVVSFLTLTLARDDVFIGDRWKIVESMLPELERVAAAEGKSSPFEYDKNGTPEDRVGIYGVYGPLLDDLSVGSAYYALVERGLASVGQHPAVVEAFGRPLSVSDIHWLGWNVIKNEPVGHSSLELTQRMLENEQVRGTLGREGFTSLLANEPVRTERFNPVTRRFDEFTIENNRAILR